MSRFIGRIPLPPITGYNDTLAWDGTEFRPTRSMSINPVLSAVSAAALAIAFGTGISDTNRIGLLPDTSILGSESVTLYVGGNAGPKWTARGAVVDKTMPDGGNVILGTGTGTKYGTATNQKQGWWGATPVVQPTGDVATALSALGLIATPTIIATTNANLTGPITSVGNATSIASQTGTGTKFVMDTSPTLVTPVIGVATGTSLSVSGQLASTVATGTAPLSISSTTVVGNLNVSQLLGATWASPAAIGSSAPAAGTFTVAQAGSGSAGAPSIAFSTDTTTGIFRGGAGVISLTSAGTEFLRLGTNQFLFSRNASVALATSPITNLANVASFHGVDASVCNLGLAAYGNLTAITARRANGTASALTASVSGDTIFGLQIIGYEGTTPGFTSARSAYSILSRETYTSTGQSYCHTWLTTLSGTTTNAERMRLAESGSLLVGTTTDGMTASGSLAIAQDLAHRGTKVGLFNATPIAQKTGYGTPTGNAYQASFAAGSITLANLAAGVAQLILDLKAYGLIGT